MTPSPTQPTVATTPLASTDLGPWQHLQATCLGANFYRLTAPNPSRMTGPGTNSYLIGDQTHGQWVIDPGPDIAEHIARLFEASAGNIHAIVCTHAHPDHAPGAFLLQQMCMTRAGKRPPIWGQSSGPHARANSQFTPDRELADGSVLDDLGPDCALHVIHTPGHAANHICLAWPAAGLLFSGDHILQGSTTVIDPPDGNMHDYMCSLDRLEQLSSQLALQTIAPAHGRLIDAPVDEIQKLRVHRLAREAKVAKAMASLPDGRPEDWVPLAYADVPQALWPLALRSLLAHVERIHHLAVPTK